MINRIVKLYCITLPFNVFAILIGGYPLTIPSVFAILLVIALVLSNRKINGKSFIVLLLFFSFAFITTVWVHGISKDILSMIVLLSLALPTTYYFKLKDIIGFDRFLIYGVLLTLPFVIYDLGVTAIGLEPLESFSPLFKKATNSPITSYFGYYRVKATFTEPSYYAIYLITILYILFELENKKNRKLVIFVTALLILTVSLTGFILMGLVLLIFLLRRKKIAFKYLVVIIIASISLTFVVDLILERIEETIMSVSNSNYGGSEGSRANSLFVMFSYLGEQDFVKFLIGEGYGKYDAWLINKFSGNELIGYSRGQIFNAFALIGIALGFIGLFLYCLFFIVLAQSRDYNKTDIIFHVVIQFSLAFIVSYLFWSVLILFKFKNILKMHKQRG